MAEPPPSTDIPVHTRRRVIRDALVFQVKLVFDGLRDVLLSPASLVAAAIGVLMSRNPGEPFYRLLKMGKRTERWLNLFGAAEVQGPQTPDGDMDALVKRLESLAADQDERERLRLSVRTALGKAKGSLRKPEKNEERPNDPD